MLPERKNEKEKKNPNLKRSKCWQEGGAPVGNVNWYVHFGKLVSKLLK